MSENIVTEGFVNTANPAPGSARNPMHVGGSDLRMLAQVEKWMTVIREINREQQEFRFDVQARGEPVANNASANVESPYEIKIDESHRGLKLAGVWRRLYFLCGGYRRSIGDIWLGMDDSKRVSIAIRFDAGGGIGWESSP